MPTAPQERTISFDTHRKVSGGREDATQGRGWPPGQCAAAMQDALSLLDGRWKLMILAQLFATSPLRFSELCRAIPAASQKMLVQQLRALEVGGVVSRTIYPEVPPRVEYRLTHLGSRLRPVFLALLDWADLQRADQDGTTTE